MKTRFDDVDGKKRLRLRNLAGVLPRSLILLIWAAGACSGGSAHPDGGSGGSGGGTAGSGGSGGGTTGSGGSDGGATASGGVSGAPVVISAATPTPRTTTWSVNYWQWSPTYGDDVTGTDALVAALKPGLMRVGGYNNDANTPDPFDEAQLDKAVAYARAIGAEPLLQVPHLADTSGQTPTAATAAAMVTYANITKGYGIKYFSVGNEPDIYPDQGGLTNSTLPAIPGYTPAAYCASVTDFVAAMKAVDPTIKIVGPDLAYKYQAGNTANDWLTPILTGCGDLFDIVAVHRYPFEAKVATLASAQRDPAAFRQVIASVRGLMQKAGQGDKPLALTEMNVAYDATTCVLDASPGTVGSALWLADSIGAAIDLGLWTSTVWDIADSEDWALGLIGTPPAHTPRPEYYAYSLFADHFGPTLLNVTSAPSGVSVHASRNGANDATDIVAVNWNGTATALSFQVTGLATTPAPAEITLPSVSIAAVEIPDTGTVKAWSYGEAQRAAASGPQSLTVGGASGGTDGGVDGGGAGAGRTVGTGCAPTDGGRTCPQVVAPGPTITTLGSDSGTMLTFGEGSDTWGSFSYASGGGPAPSAAVTADGNGLQIVGGSQGPGDYEGVGLYYNSSSCLNAAAYSGVKFDFSGTLGTCQLRVGISYSTDVPPTDDPVRGTCTAAASSCYGPLADVTTTATAAAATAATVKVSFASMNGGSPTATADPTSIISVQWQLLAATGGPCTANFTVENVAFY